MRRIILIIHGPVLAGRQTIPVALWSQFLLGTGTRQQWVLMLRDLVSLRRPSVVVEFSVASWTQFLLGTAPR